MGKLAVIKKTLLERRNGIGPIKAWADATTDTTSLRRHDLLRDKSRVVSNFFGFIGKPPSQVQPSDIKEWQVEIESRGLSASTVYGMISKVSSFYRWALENGPNELRDALRYNPVDLARPKAPKAYQSESSKALDDKEVLALLRVVKSKAEEGSIACLRDHAMLLHLILTGRRRQEVIGLRWGDVQMDSGSAMVVSYRVKGGEIETRSIEDERIKESMLKYLQASGRFEGMEENTPIWTRHDRAGKPGKTLTSYAFACNVKRYAMEAGIGDIHLHQLRHTFARMAGDESGSLAEVQEALGHKSQSTTRIYLQRVGVKKDRFSCRLAKRLGI